MCAATSDITFVLYVPSRRSLIARITNERHCVLSRYSPDSGTVRSVDQRHSNWSARSNASAAAPGQWPRRDGDVIVPARMRNEATFDAAAFAALAGRGAGKCRENRIYIVRARAPNWPHLSDAARRANPENCGPPTGAAISSHDITLPRPSHGSPFYTCTRLYANETIRSLYVFLVGSIS